MVYEELVDVIIEGMEECDNYRLCAGCKYEKLPCCSKQCQSLLVADNILKHYDVKEKQND
jgi:hypothetical protein